jgi:hypothetical protein
LVVDEHGDPVHNARVDVIVGNELFSSGYTNVSGTINAVISTGDNLVYVRYNSYTPVQYIYNGSGLGVCITISIYTCQPMRQEPLDEGRFLVWLPVAYCAREQTMPIEICGDDRNMDNVVCDRFDPESNTDNYPLPVRHNDSIKWVMDTSEVDYDGDDVSNLRIGISKDGVLVSEDIGTIVQAGTQLFCEANIPCILDCEYEFVIYRIDVIDFIGVIVTPPSSLIACDGIIQVVVNLGTPPYEYSLDLVNWQPSDTFSGICGGEYTAYARDSDCSQGQANAYLLEINCGDFKGKTLQQVIDLGITLGQIVDAGCTLCDFVPIVDVQTDLVNEVHNGDLSLGDEYWTVAVTGSASITFGDGYAQVSAPVGSQASLSQAILPSFSNGGYHLKFTITDFTTTANDGAVLSTSYTLSSFNSNGDYDITVPNGQSADDPNVFEVFAPSGVSFKISNIEYYQIYNCS